MMSSDHPPESPGDEGSPSLDLGSLFSHPAGLRVARGIARPLIIAHLRSQHSKLLQKSPLATIQTPFSASSPAPLTFDSSPEVAILLREILAFSEGEAETPKQREVSGYGTNKGSAYDMSRGVPNPIPAASTLASQLSNALRTNTLSRPRTSSTSHTHPTNQSGRWPFAQPSSLAHSSATASSSINFDPTSTPQREDSPYRVESPSVQQQNPINPTQFPAQHYAMAESQTGIRSLEAEPDVVMAASSLLGLNRGVPDRPDRPHANPSGAIASTTSPSNQQRTAKTPSTSTSPLIKGFLPVNKAVDGKDKRTHSHTLKTTRMQDTPEFNRIDSFAQMTDVTSPVAAHHTSSDFVPIASSSPLTTSNIVEGQPSAETGSEDVIMAGLPAKKVRKKRKAKEVGENGEPEKKVRKPYKKRKAAEVEIGEDGEPLVKKPRKERKKAPPKVKVAKPESAKTRLPDHIWMRILEFTPPKFLYKARLIDKKFNAIVEGFDSIFANQRKENFGPDMPVKPFGLSERQYSNLLGGKGCMEEKCEDRKTSRTHWSWAKRWCWECWKQKIQREDRVLKHRQNQYGRGTLIKMLECIPIGMYDSFLKPHDYVEDLDARPRTAPRLYRYYLKDDVEAIVKEYEALTPEPHKDDPEKTPEENAAAQTKYNEKVANLEQSRTDFFAERKAKNDAHMKLVLQIEGAVRKRREGNAKPYEENRKARRELFLKRAGEDIPHINEDFIKTTKAFKAATRIFRDPGSERGWKALKPKIEKEWEDAQTAKPEGSTVENLAGDNSTMSSGSRHRATGINLDGADDGESILSMDSLDSDMAMEQIDDQIPDGQDKSQQLDSFMNEQRDSGNASSGLLGFMGQQFNISQLTDGQSDNLQLNSSLLNGHNSNYQGNNRASQSHISMHEQNMARRLQFRMFARPNMFLPKMPGSMGFSSNGFNHQNDRSMTALPYSQGAPDFLGKMSNSMLAFSANGLIQQNVRSMTALPQSQGANGFSGNSWNGDNNMNFFTDQATSSLMNVAYPATTMSANLAMPRPVSHSIPLNFDLMDVDQLPRPLSLPELNPNQTSNFGTNQFHAQSASPQPSSKIPVSSLLSGPNHTSAAFNPYA